MHLPSEWSHMFPHFHFHSDVVVTTFEKKKKNLLLIPSCSFSSRFTICHKTEVVKNTLNPVWQPFTIPVRALCNGDYDRYELPRSSHLPIATAAVYPFTAAFACFYHASPASTPALKTLTSTILSHGGQHGGSLQNFQNTNRPTGFKAVDSVFLHARRVMNNLLLFIFCSCCVPTFKWMTSLPIHENKTC